MPLIYNQDTDLNKYFKSSWNKWDKYINKLKQKKINCLDIGANSGYISCWMLNNLCINSHSVVFSIDTWDDVNEDIFDYNIALTNKVDYNVKIKTKYQEGILKFKNYGVITFDIIFINLNIDKSDILSNAILAWDLIDVYGLLIFDNYSESTIDTDSKTIIDNFINLFKLQLVVKYTEQQFIIKKIKRKNDNKPELAEYYKLLEDIQNFKFIQINEEFNEEIIDDFDIELVYSDKKEEFEDKNITTIFNNINDILKKYPEIDKQLLMYNNKNIEYINLNSQYIDMFNNLRITYNKYLYRQINYYYFSKYINKDDKILICDNIDITDIYTYINRNSSIINENINIFNTDYINNKNEFNTLLNKNIKYNNIFIIYNIYPINILIIILILNKQMINGNCVLTITIKTPNNIYKLLYILKKYYKKILITQAVMVAKGQTIEILLSNFVGINNNELIKLNSLLNNDMNNIDNYKIIIKTNNIKYNNFKNIIFKIIYKLVISIEKQILLMSRILLNNNNKLLKLFFNKKITNLLYYMYKQRLND